MIMTYKAACFSPEPMERGLGNSEGFPYLFGKESRGPEPYRAAPKVRVVMTAPAKTPSALHSLGDGARCSPW
jgi:hypothetical protein